MTRPETDITAVREDIAYLRQLAEGGAGAPQLSGAVLVVAAIVFGAANLGQYLLLSGRVDVGPWGPLGVWLVASAIFMVFLILTIRRFRAMPGVESASTKAVNAAWSGVGFGIFAIWAGLMAVGFTTGDWTAMRAMPIVVAAAYGSAWMIAGTISGRGWMTFVALVAYGSAVLIGALMATNLFYVALAAMLAACALIPGLVLMRRPESAARKPTGGTA